MNQEEEKNDLKADRSRGLRRNYSGVGQCTSRPLYYRRQGRRLRAHAGQPRPDTRHRASTNTGQPSSSGALNRVTGHAATSPEDAQKQMQGQPTAAQEAQGAQPSAKMTDQGC
jgi:hypothetical protein